MKNFAGLLLIGYVLFNSFTATAQTYAESALLFSRIRPGGSARIQALGGAQVSLGGDYSSAYSNPAGLGMYNRSEFTFSPGVTFANTTSDYLGTSTGSARSQFIIPGLSLAFHSDKNKGKIISGTFGISYNRTNDFNRTFEYGGVNKDNSIIDYFINDAMGYDSTQFDPDGDRYYHPTGVAYYNYLINPVPGNPTHYYSDVSVTAITQLEQVRTRGNQNQVNFAYGVNLNDHVFLGGGIGLATINYGSTKTYSEVSPEDPLLRSLVLVESLTTSGTGLNATIGAIFKPMDVFQLGLSVATPTGYFSLTDNYSVSMTTDWKDFPYGTANVPGPELHAQPATSYQFVTPWRFSGGATFFIQKQGFLTADVEYVNYGGSKYSPVSNYYTQQPADAYDPDNADIKASYNSVFNFRLGGEYRLNSFRFRGGFSYMPDPYKSLQNDTDNSIQSFSGGFGYRTSKFFVDLTGTYSKGNTTYRPYTGSPLVTNQNTGTLVMATVGFPF